MEASILLCVFVVEGRKLLRKNNLLSNSLSYTYVRYCFIQSEGRSRQNGLLR